MFGPYGHSTHKDKVRVKTKKVVELKGHSIRNVHLAPKLLLEPIKVPITLTLGLTRLKPVAKCTTN